MTREDIKAAAASEARKFAETAGKHAEAKAEGFKETVADQTDAAADAASDLRDAWPDGTPHHQLAREVAGALSSYADYLKGSDIDEITGDLRDFAHRRPRTFLAGAALVGFALARVATLKPAPRIPAPAPEAADERA